jgi:putative membrane protein
MKHLIRLLKGIVIGIATLIPGVSGGTMAIILGVYNDLIDGVSEFFTDWKKYTVILGEIGLGGLMGFLLLSKILSSALDTYPLEMQFLFIGIICGGIPTLVRKTKEYGKVKPSDFVFLVIGIALLFLMLLKPNSLITVTGSVNFLSMFILFIAGIIIAIALVLPGISASFMLLTPGIYEFTLKAIKQINLSFLITLGLGLIIGTIGTAKVIKKCLEKY